MLLKINCLNLENSLKVGSKKLFPKEKFKKKKNITYWTNSLIL